MIFFSQSDDRNVIIKCKLSVGNKTFSHCENLKPSETQPEMDVSNEPFTASKDGCSRAEKKSWVLIVGNHDKKRRRANGACSWICIDPSYR